MFEDLAIPIENLQIKLPPAVRALFEPVSGMMIMNVTDAEFHAMQRDMNDPLAEVFVHEMYHCFQVYTCGYFFARVERLADAFRSEYQARHPLHHAPGQIFRYYFGKVREKVTTWLPRRIRFHLQAQSVGHAYLRDYAELQELSGRSQVTLLGARFSGLYSKLSELKKEALSTGKDGLSPNDLLESSAAVYGRLTCQQTPSTTLQLLEYLEALTETYSRALRKSFEICGDRAKDIILPAITLALRYERPENAYCELVRCIAQSAGGDEVAAAKSLAAKPPSIEEAGAVLGTAVDVRGKIASKFLVYKQQMDALATGLWGIDELDLLTNPKAIGSVPVGSLGFGIRTRESVRGPSNGLYIAAIMLRGGPSLYHVEMETIKSMLELSRSLMGIPPPQADREATDLED